MRKKHFAYIDKGGILHVSKSYKTAVEYAENGKIVVTYQEAGYGYPMHNGETILVYGEEDMKVTGDGPKIPPVEELAKLYRECR